MPLILGLVFSQMNFSTENVANCELNDLKQEFPLENKNIWYAIESGINEIVNLEKPSVFIFLYQENDRNKLNSFLKYLSEYSNCRLNTNGAINLEGKDLNTKENLKSYGKLINTYQEELNEKGVMIIKNVDMIEAYVAQALHSFCDEYTPLVKKSIILFTIKVDDSKENDVKIAENILRKKWNTLKGDTLEPLLTRVTGMVLKFE